MLGLKLTPVIKRSYCNLQRKYYCCYCSGVTRGHDNSSHGIGLFSIVFSDILNKGNSSQARPTDIHSIGPISQFIWFFSRRMPFFSVNMTQFGWILLPVVWSQITNEGSWLSTTWGSIIREESVPYDVTALYAYLLHLSYSHTIKVHVK